MKVLLERKPGLRIAMLDNFMLNVPAQARHCGRKLIKGLIRNGHDVMAFCYLNHLMRLSPFKSRGLSRWVAKRKTDRLACRLLADYRPDLVILIGYRYVDAETISRLRAALPQARFLGWYRDTLDAVPDDFIATNGLLDCFLATGGGEHLKAMAARSGIPGAFMANPCDGEIERRYAPDPALASELFFTGKLAHGSCPSDPMRESLIQELIDRYGLVIHGGAGRPMVVGLDYFRRISNARIAISINTSNDIRLYHSDRFINYLGCGPLVVARRVPDSDLLFEDGEHLRYFTTPGECLDLVEYYLAHPDEAEQIGRRGMLHAHEKFNAVRIARDIIDFVTTGTYDEPWRDITEPPK